jgi:hypothetical protein
VLAPRDSTSIKFVEFSLQLFHHALPHAFEARLNGHEPCFMGSLQTLLQPLPDHGDLRFCGNQVPRDRPRLAPGDETGQSTKQGEPAHVSAGAARRDEVGECIRHKIKTYSSCT